MKQEELNKAAEDSWALYEYREHPQGLYASCYQDGFIAGAKWAMEQGVVADGEIGYWNQTGLSILLDKSLEKLGFDMDEKVIIQIRKKDE